MKQIEGVTRSGEVQVEARILRIQPVISEIVDPAEAKRGAELISFCGMIVNYMNSEICSPNCPLLEYCACGAKNPIVL